MESTLNREARPSQLITYCGDDPLAIAMAQSGIEASDQWPFLDRQPELGGVFSPVTSDFSTVTSDLSPMTSDLSPVKSDLSPVTSDLSPVTSDLSAVKSWESEADFGQLTCLQRGDGGLLDDQLYGEVEEDEVIKDDTVLENSTLDSWLSSYYYVVDDASGNPDDPDPDPDPDLAGYLDLSPPSLLPRLVASLGWTDASRRPPYTFEELAALAICSSAQRRLTARLAAQFVRQVYPFYRQDERLQASLEKALFLGPFFRRVSSPGGSVNRPWTVTCEGERRLAASVRRRLAGHAPWRPARPAWQEDHSYAAQRPAQGPAAGRRRVKLATKT